MPFHFLIHLCAAVFTVSAKDAPNIIYILADDLGYGDLSCAGGNGCSPAAKIPALVAKGHKADIFEGGHRTPFLFRWPGKVKAGSTSSSRSHIGGRPHWFPEEIQSIPAQLDQLDKVINSKASVRD
jgi:arylsulfatase A-like enzyme